MYTTEYVVRQFSKTPLKHRMSRYLLEKILKDEDLLQRIEFVAAGIICQHDVGCSNRLRGARF